jgi:AhpD family alkylhydroperoxidase
MEERIDYSKAAPGATRGLLEVEKYLRECGLEERLINLIKLRVSQINGCAFCIDMHWKDLRVMGENEQRLYSLDAWEEAPYYSERERAALAWAEAITCVSESHVPDDVYEEAKKHFGEKELADLTMAAALINAWNRIAIALRTTPGTYQPVGRDLKKVAWKVISA